MDDATAHLMVMKFGLRRPPSPRRIALWAREVQRLTATHSHMSEESIAQQAARQSFPDYRRIWYPGSGKIIDVKQIMSKLQDQENTVSALSEE